MSHRFLLGFALLIFVGTAHGQAASDHRSLQQRAEAGDASAQVALGHQLSDQKHQQAAVGWYRKAAEQGNADGEWMLGTVSFYGEGVPPDSAKGVDLMRKSITQDGNAEHMAGLSMMLMASGSPDALMWAHRAAEAGSTRGMFLLGALNLVGADKNANKAMAAKHWMSLAAQKGDAQAQQALGGLYFSNMLGPKNPTAGARLLQQSADAGNARAAGMLAAFLISGEDLPVDGPRGVALARKAAAGGMLGHLALGKAYAGGIGVKRDPARAWYEFATAQAMDTKNDQSNLAKYMSQQSTHLSEPQLDKLQARVDRETKARKAAHDSGKG